VAELVNQFAWSWSRHQTFYECARKLYWQYYGSWGGWDDDAAPDARTAYQLKHIQSLSMLVGRTFHAVVSDMLHNRSAEPTSVPVGQMQLDMERRLRKKLDESRRRDWKRYGRPNRYTNIFEDYYGSGVDDATRERAIDELRACVDGFAATQIGQRAFRVPRERMLFIDEDDFDKKRVTRNGIVVYASPDLVVRDATGGVHIVDWKTGKEGKASIEQLAAYGLFVAERFGEPVERMTAYLVYARSGRVEPHADLAPGSRLALARMDTYVSDVRGRLTNVDLNLAGDRERFPMTSDLRLCARCKFRELCGRMDQPAVAPTGDDDLDP